MKFEKHLEKNLSRDDRNNDYFTNIQYDKNVIYTPQIFLSCSSKIKEKILRYNHELKYCKDKRYTKRIGKLEKKLNELKSKYPEEFLII